MVFFMYMIQICILYIYMICGKYKEAKALKKKIIRQRKRLGFTFDSLD